MVCIYYLTVLLILNLRFESTVKTKGYQTPKLFIVQVTSLRVLLKHKVIKPG